MSKKLVWKAFETFEEMEEYKTEWLASLTPEQLEAREVTMQAIKAVLLNCLKSSKPDDEPKPEGSKDS